VSTETRQRRGSDETVECGSEGQRARGRQNNDAKVLTCRLQRGRSVRSIIASRMHRFVRLSCRHFYSIYIHRLFLLLALHVGLFRRFPSFASRAIVWQLACSSSSLVIEGPTKCIFSDAAIGPSVAARLLAPSLLAPSYWLPGSWFAGLAASVASRKAQTAWCCV
jgi:hypothetical protein